MNTGIAAAGVRRENLDPQRYDLSRFRVVGHDNELLAFTKPVEVRRTSCGTSK